MKQGCLFSYLKPSSLKWATVIHQPPPETLWMLTLAGSPTGLNYFSISAYYFSDVSAHFSLCGASFLLLKSVGMFFWGRGVWNFFHCQPFTTETRLHCCLFLHYSRSSAVSLFSFVLNFLFHLLRVDPMPHDTPKPPGYTRFVCISDTHSRTDAIQMPYGDVFIHAGDFTELGLPSEVKKFNDWLGQRV